MKNNRNCNALPLILLMIVSLTFISVTRAQSTDIDNPTILTANVIDGEGDGKAETFYYTFTALKGDVKVTLDAKTDNYSVIMDAALTDEDGKELLMISAVANDTGKREVGTKHFVRPQKVILRVRLPKDNRLKLLTYRVKLDGAVKVEIPVVPVEAAPVDPAAQPTAVSPTDPNAVPPPTALVTDPAATPVTDPDAPKTSIKEKAKAKAKKEAKKVINKVIDN